MLHFRSINAHVKPGKALAITRYTWHLNLLVKGQKNVHWRFFKHCIYVKFSYKIWDETENGYDEICVGDVVC
jgi:hypothetical protein